MLGIIPHRILAAYEIDTIIIPLLQRSMWGLGRLARWLKVLEPVVVKLGFEPFQKVDAYAMCLASDTFIQKHSPQGVLLPYNFRPLVLCLFSGKSWTILAASRFIESVVPACLQHIISQVTWFPGSLIVGFPPPTHLALRSLRRR